MTQNRMAAFLDTILVDLDNTLYDYDSAGFRARELVLARIASAANVDVRSLSAAYSKVVIETRSCWYSSGYSMRLARFEAVKRALGIAFDATKMVGWLDRALLREISPYPGAVEALNLLRKEFRIAIITDGYSDIQESICAQLGISDKVTVFSAYSSRTSKEDGTAYELVSDRLHADRNRSVVVGDNWARDVMSAARARFRQIWIAHGRSVPGRPDGFLGAVDDFAEVPKFLGVGGAVA